MHISALDLNLLNVAAALFRHRNVSKAAAELGLSQSAVSHALARLREQFKDPLFVRTAKGMAPTDYAAGIESEIGEILRRAERLITRRENFDPRVATGRITIATTDYFEIVVMPRLQEILAREAPLLQVSLRPTKGELPKRELEEGQIDFAVAGFYRDLPEGFYQVKLFSDPFVCAAGKGHPLFTSKRLSEDEYFRARHALITLQGDFREKASRGRERQIVYGSYSFTGMAWVLQEAPVLLTAPQKLVDRYAAFFPLRVWPCPTERPPIDVRMLWHERTQADPLRVWLRKRLREVCAAV